MGTGDAARFEQAAALLPYRLRRFALALPEHVKERAEELRLRVERRMTVLTAEGELAAAPEDSGSTVRQEDLEQLLGTLTEYSRYAALDTLCQGFLSVRGGFRVGVCGTAVLRDGAVHNIRDISSVAIRIVRQLPGLAEELTPRLLDGEGRFLSTLILAPPGGGKTTLLRDLIRCLSLGGEGRPALRVCVADERSELAVTARGIAQMELGSHTDVLDGCPKALAVPMLLRAMDPQVIALDEIVSEADVDALCAAANCGVALLATVHAADVEELRRKPLYRRLLRSGVFRRAVRIAREDGARRFIVEDEGCFAPAARP